MSLTKALRTIPFNYSSNFNNFCDSNELDLDRESFELFLWASFIVDKVHPGDDIREELTISYKPTQLQMLDAGEEEEKLGKLKKTRDETLTLALSENTKQNRKAAKDADNAYRGFKSSMKKYELSFSAMERKEVKNHDVQLHGAAELWGERGQSLIRLADLAVCIQVKGLKSSNVKNYMKAVGLKLSATVALEYASTYASAVPNLVNNESVKQRCISISFLRYHTKLAALSGLAKMMLDEFPEGTDEGRMLRKHLGGSCIKWVEDAEADPFSPEKHSSPPPRLVAAVYYYMEACGTLPQERWYQAEKEIVNVGSATRAQLQAGFKAWAALKANKAELALAATAQDVLRITTGNVSLTELQNDDLKRAAKPTHERVRDAVEKLASKSVNEVALKVFNSVIHGDDQEEDYYHRGSAGHNPHSYDQQEQYYDQGQHYNFSAAPDLNQSEANTQSEELPEAVEAMRGASHTSE